MVFEKKADPEPATAPAAAPPRGKEPLKPYPFHDGQVNENAAQRVVRLVMPQCPIAGEPELKQRDGTYKPNPAFTGEANCQQVTQDRAGRWDVESCIEKGHDPYHFSLRRTVVEEVVSDDGYVTNALVRNVVEKRLNIVPVSISKRVGSGLMLQLALARGGKRLEEFGYWSPCEFRSCSRKPTISTKNGNYCNERHARLVALATRARRSSMLLVPTDPMQAEADLEENEDLLNSINIDARAI